MDRGQNENKTGKTCAAADHQQCPHSPELTEPLACEVGSGCVMTTHPSYQARGKRYGGEADQNAGRAQDETGGVVDVRIFLQCQQGKVERGMQSDRARPPPDAAPGW